MKQRDGSIVLYKNSKPFLCKDTIRVCRFIHRCPPPQPPPFFFFSLSLSLYFEKRALLVLFELLFAFLYMEDQYGMADLGQYMSGRASFPPQQPLLSAHRGPYTCDMIMFRSSDNAATAALPIGNGGGGVAGRWPRQETLTLLEIRSRLDSKFKEANQKGPLWDEVSRIMSEEHAYQRSGKKCREKFENLYKYYKKTKEGKAGRQDGKHYRFFRQLEALYGTETNNSASVSETHFNSGSFNPNLSKIISTSSANNQESYPGFKLSDASLTLSNSCDFDPTSSDDSENEPGIDDNNPNMKKRRGKRGWKVKIKEFIDTQMKKLMDKQEAWMAKMMKTIEDRERERIVREEEWRKQDAERMERERNLWASERAWIEARDASLMDTLHKMARKEPRASPQDQEVMVTDIPSLSQNYHNDDGSETITNSLKCNVFWPECEISRLIQLRKGMESKFHEQSGISEEVLWEEISTKMACFGYDKSGLCCREKWQIINNKCNKKRKENSRSICASYYQNYESMCNQGGGSYCDHIEVNRNNNSPVVANNTGNGVSTDTCLRYYMGDVYGRIVD
ncbi:trihelix transcription factor PTL-like isoform X1 [Henckelia pumila]|uniref:trihelix transcription factor PTL-like isoform X1 n=1 Tax=Henckelia pumila TaxID=405737 RepID=UPI003C6E9E62